jgi:hypothetical protein
VKVAVCAADDRAARPKASSPSRIPRPGVLRIGGPGGAVVMSHPRFPPGSPLAATAQGYYLAGVSGGTHAAESKAIADYQFWVASIGGLVAGKLERPTVDDFVFYASYLASTGAATEYVRRRVSMVGAHFEHHGWGNPLHRPDGATHVRIHRVLRGIARRHALARRKRLPVTVPLLRRLLNAMPEGSGVSPDDQVVYAAALTAGVFGLLRTGELVAPGTRSADGDATAQVGDVTLAGSGDRRYFEFNIRKSKVDTVRKEHRITVHETGGIVCPYDRMEQLLEIHRRRGVMAHKPLLTLGDGTFVTRDRLVRMLRRLLKCLGLEPKDWGGHSLRGGGVTTLAAAGWADVMLATLGRFASDAYKLYLTTPLATVREAHCSMAALSDDAYARNQGLAAAAAARARIAD